MNNFLKNILKIFIFTFLCTFFVLLILEQDYIYSSKRNLFEADHNKIKCLITGSSHTYWGLNPKNFPFYTINIAEVNKPIGIDIDFIEKNIDKFNNLQYIIIPIDYFTFYYTGKNDLYSHRYYHHWNVKNSSNIINDYQNYHLLTCGFINGFKELFQRISYDTLNGFSPHFSDFSKISDVQKINESKNRIESWHQNWIDTTDAIIIRDRITNLVTLLNKKGIKTIFVNMPVTNTFKKLYHTNIVSSNTLMLENLIKETNAIQVNLQQYKIFEDESLFNDCDHLNVKGANIASNEIIKVLLSNKLKINQ